MVLHLLFTGDDELSLGPRDEDSIFEMIFPRVDSNINAWHSRIPFEIRQNSRYSDSRYEDSLP